ncbi:hypothetical protein ACFL27_08920 [candidate division CSSED10-310 bacterium]|uniref:Uncharacterized protein n=1 Tax=candidate division CSSED10-310 bacterium TaxID=2855610 RepID=A0ABV6YVS0_UNCC1
MVSHNDSNKQDTDNIPEKIKKILSKKIAENRLNISSDGAVLTPPPSQEEIIMSLEERLHKMTSAYTLGLEETKSDFFDCLKYLNEHFYFDRPPDFQVEKDDPKGSLKLTVKKHIFPLIRSSMNTIFERQRLFNAELVKLLNHLTEVLGNQRDYNMDVMKFCERMIDHYRTMEQMERRLDDFFCYATRIAILEEDMELLKEKIDSLEKQNNKNAK